MALSERNLLFMDQGDSISGELQEKLDEIFGICYYCSSFDEGVEKINDVELHLLIADIDEDSVNGLKMIRVLRKKIPALPVMVLSAKQDEEIDKTLGNLKIDGIIPKPLKTDTVLERIKMVEKKIEAFAEKDKAGKESEKPKKSLSIEESIDHFFKKTLTDLAQFDKTDKFNRKMRFSIMKTFLFTAYNNFKEMDPTFEDEQMKFAKEKLESCIKLQYDLQRRMNFAMEVNYENIFLSKQIPYVEMSEQYEGTKEKLEKLRNELAFFTRQMEEAKEKMKQSKKGSDNYMKFEQDFKRANGKNVDRVHAIKEETAQLEQLDEKMEAFRKEHFPAFKKVFSESSEDIKADVDSALDILAYKFDQQIWRRAKKSRNIRDFFANARIQGLFSCKTYLEYFVGNLDPKTASPTNSKIIKYLAEYNSVNKLRVAVIGSDTRDISRDKEVIERIDPVIEVHGYINPDMLLKKFEETYYKVIVSYIEITRNMNALKFAQEFKNKFPDDFDDVAFVLKYDARANKKDFMNAVTFGYRHFVQLNTPRESYVQLMLDAL